MAVTRIEFGESAQPGEVTLITVEDRVASQDAATRAEDAATRAEAAEGTFTAPANDVVATMVTNPGPTKDALVTFTGIKATGFAGSPDFVQQATLSPSPVDKRTIDAPKPGLKVGVRKEIGVNPLTDKITLDNDIVAGNRRNLWRYTEDLSNAAYAVASTAAKGTAQITVDGITLTRLTSADFYGSLRSQLTGLGIPLFTTGRRYLLSYYVLSDSDVEKFFWMRYLSTGSVNGHGQKLVQPNKLTRVWELVQATSTTTVARFTNPANGYADGTAGDLYWLFQGNADGGALDLYVGGFQVDDVGTAAVDGIAGIGDSTMQGSSGSTDAQAAREWMGYLAGLLNVHTFNRGIGGNKLTDMDARWATDITPLAPVSKYVIIQGGINDIANGATLATVQGAVTSMVSKAKADGMIPVHLTCTPTATIGNNPAYESVRTQFNAWLKQTYPNVIDIASVVADPFDPKYLRRTPDGVNGWWGDGTHYAKPAKRAIAEFIAAWPGWEFPKPSPYQKIAATTFTQTGGFVVTSPDGTKYRLTVANGGAISAVAI